MANLGFTTAALALASSTGATTAAGLGFSTQAAVLAGGATVLVWCEKAPLSREKWAHYLNTSAQLEVVHLSFVYGESTKEAVAWGIGEIGTEYASKLPIAHRPNESEVENDA